MAPPHAAMWVRKICICPGIARILSADCMNGPQVTRRRIGVIHLHGDDECSKSKIHNLLKYEFCNSFFLHNKEVGGPERLYE